MVVLVALAVPTFLFTSFASGQNATTPSTESAVNLYRKLSSIGLDPKQIYDVRDAAIDREDIHLSLDDGTIAFTEGVDGQITGALFAGEGEALVVPPNQVERHSLAMFTSSAVLNEKFTLAYFRFSDKHFLSDLQPALRQPQASAEFLEKHNSLAKALAGVDALRCLMALTSHPRPESEPNAPSGEFIRMRINSAHVGSFDLIWDTMQVDQIAVGQASFTDHGRFYDEWMLFPMRSIRKRDEERHQKHLSPDDLYIDSVLITDYKIRTDVHPPTDLNVDATLTLDVRASDERTILFELSRYLKVSSVTLETTGPPQLLEFIQNEALEGTELSKRGNDLVAVVFPQPLAAGQKMKLRFTYAGSVLSEAGGGLLYVGARGTWFPNRGPWMSNFDLQFKYPVAWKLVATGKRVEQKTEGGDEISRFLSERPIPLAGFNLGKYVVASAHTNSANTVVESYATRGMENAFRPTLKQDSLPPVTRIGAEGDRPDRRAAMLPAPASTPPDPARNASIVAERAARTIDFLVSKLGPYPYSALSLTQMPGPDSQGWPGLVFLSSQVFLTPAERHSLGPAEQVIYDRVMEAHETAHQWWGDAVFWQSYRDQWMMESLANYSALLELESERPDQVKVVLDYYRRALLAPAPGGSQPRKDAGPVSLGVRLNSSKFGGAYDFVAYGRGTWLLHMLRHMFRDTTLIQANGGALASAPGKGKASRAKIQHTLNAPEENSKSFDPDSLFYAALQSIQKKFAGKVMSTKDLELAFEEFLPASLRFEGKRSLDWFFEGWVDGTVIPKLELDNVKLTSSPGKATMTARATLRQKDAPDTLVTSVPIYASTADGRLELVDRVFADGQETPIKLNVPAGTKKLLVDPFQTVLTSN